MFILFTFSSLSLQSPTAHSLLIFTSSFCLFPSSFCSTVTLTSFSQFSSLRFLLQIQVHSFLFINFFLLFFSPISLLPQDFTLKVWFSVFTFRPGRNGTIFKTLVHAVSEKWKKEKKRYRSDTLMSVLRKHSSSFASSGHRPLVCGYGGFRLRNL